MQNRQVHNQVSDDYDVLSAIWILSCNDENPIITYEGIRHRLGLPQSYDVRRLVKSRGELFRPSVSSQRLARWKQDLLLGKSLPSWIREIEDETARKLAIENINSDDIFRSQFRAERDAPRAPIEVIKWGLEHIDRLRKANVEMREDKRRRWAEIIIPVLSTIVTIVAVSGGFYFQSQSIAAQSKLQEVSLIEQRRLKYYEVELSARQNGYSTFIQALNKAYESASKNNANSLNLQLNNMDSLYYGIEPLLQGETADQRQPIWNAYQQIKASCLNLVSQTSGTQAYEAAASSLRTQNEVFRAQLYQALINPR